MEADEADLGSQHPNKDVGCHAREGGAVVHDNEADSGPCARQTNQLKGHRSARYRDTPGWQKRTQPKAVGRARFLSGGRRSPRRERAFAVQQASCEWQILRPRQCRYSVVDTSTT